MKHIQFVHIISLMFIFLLAAGFAAAEIDVITYSASRDFSLTSGSDQLNVCSCANSVDSVIVTNSGTFGAIFSVSINPELAGKVKLSESSFELAPGDSRNVYIYYTASCTEHKDSLVLTVSSNLGVQKSISKIITVSKCQNIEMWITNPKDAIKPCQESSFLLYVHNTGPFSDIYALDSDNDAVKFTANTFTLAPNQIAMINTSVKFDCNANGQRNITFKAQSLKNQLEAYITGTVYITPDYGYDVKIGNASISNISERQPLDVCDRIYSSIPITITNFGVDNNFKFESSGLPGFAKIVGVDNGGSIFVAKGQSKTITLTVDTQAYRKEYKSYNLEFRFIPLYGNDPKTQKYSLNLKPCYEHSITILDKDGNSQKYPQATCAAALYNHDIKVQNNGLFTENISLVIDGTKDAALSTNSLVVKPGEYGKASLFVQGPLNKGVYDIKVYAKLSNGIVESDNLWINAFNSYDCFKVALKSLDYKINYDSKSIPVVLESWGIADSDYTIAWNGPSFISPNATRISMKSKQQSTILLDVKSFNVSEGVYSGNLSIINKATGISYDHQISVVLKDKSGFTKAFEFFWFGSACKQFSFWLMIAIIIACILIILFMIFGPHYPYKFGNRVRLKIPVLIVLIVVFLLGVVLVLIFAGLPKTSAEVYNITTNATDLRFEWLENEKYVVNAAQFFYDADNNTLSYKVSDISNVKTSVKGDLITFYPDLGWSGERDFTITASDSQGGKTQSPSMTLSVLALHRKTTLQLYEIYCWYSNLAIFIILLVLIFLMFIVKQKRRTRK